MAVVVGEVRSPGGEAEDHNRSRNVSAAFEPGGNVETRP